MIFVLLHVQFDVHCLQNMAVNRGARALNTSKGKDPIGDTCPLPLLDFDVHVGEIP